MMPQAKSLLSGCVVLALGTTLQTTAQSQPGSPAISIELNRIHSSDKGCQITFVLKNDFTENIEKASYEVVLFNKEGLVDRMTIFDFQSLPASKTKVRQFDLKGTDCNRVSRILINGAKECKVKNRMICSQSLRLKNKTDIDFID